MFYNFNCLKSQIIIVAYFNIKKCNVFKEMNENGNDRLLINDIFENENLEE